MKNSNNKNYLIAIDLGTSTLKVAIFNIEGKLVESKSVEHPLSYPGKDLVENDLEKYWEAIAELINKTLRDLDDDPSNILAVSLSSQAETIVPVDKDIKPLRPAIVWLDGRSAKEAEEIASVFDEDKLFKITGLPSSDPMWPSSKIKWIQNNEPQIFKVTHKFLLLEDYISYRLTGRIFGEATVYNSSYYYDINKLEYYKPMLDYLNITEDKLPEIVYTGKVMGNISPIASTETGLSTSTKFVAGSMDQVAGAIGAGNIQEGMTTETTGTAFAMIVTINKPLIDKESRLPCQLHVVQGKYCLMPFSMTGGMVFKWFKDNFFDSGDSNRSSDNEIYNLMTSEASRVPPGSDGLIMLPHITGAFFPENNPKAKGVFFGISMNHGRGHFTRAILESIAFMLRRDLEILSNNNIKINSIISMGGGAKSDTWNQIKADTTGLEIIIPENTEAALLGAAIIAGVGIGIYKNYDQAVKDIVKIKHSYKPNPDNKKIYGASYKKYNDLYSKVKGLF
ncbi:FGGY-family carbohydrate kinase [Actinomycetota bacterium]